MSIQLERKANMEDWEKRFDEQFNYEKSDYDLQDIKSFIRSILPQVREEEVKYLVNETLMKHEGKKRRTLSYHIAKAIIAHLKGKGEK